MTWWHTVVEARHELQNPTSPAKIRELGERLGLCSDSHVLDIASGNSGPALLLAEAFGCRLTCVERASEFVATARERTAAAGLEDRIDIVEADASTHEPGRYDTALCLGATFAYGGLVPTLERLRARIGRGGAKGRGRVAASRRALDEWLAANPGHPQVEEFRARGAAQRVRYLAWERAVMGWAIFVCRT